MSLKKLKNYTSEVSINKSIQKIESQLMDHGAKEILKIIDNGKVIGIAFIVDVNGKEIPFRLPARVERVEKKLQKEIRRPMKGTMERIAEQAGRTAWKILSDWVDIQMAIIDLDQVELAEIFLSFAYDHSTKQTFFEKTKMSGFNLLEDKTIKLEGRFRD
jgi:hypothetical protein